MMKRRGLTITLLVAEPVGTVVLKVEASEYADDPMAVLTVPLAVTIHIHILGSVHYLVQDRGSRGTGLTVSTQSFLQAQGGGLFSGGAVGSETVLSVCVDFDRKESQLLHLPDTLVEGWRVEELLLTGC